MLLFDYVNMQFIASPTSTTLDGITATAAEVNVLTGATAGQMVASKALVAGAGGSLAFGLLSSANDTSGVHLTAAVTKAVAVHADTGGVALGAGFARAGLSRFLIGTAITSGADISAAGHEGLLKFTASANMIGNCGGVMGHLESVGTLTLTGNINTVKSGVASFVDLATGATVAASTVVSAFGVNAANLGTLTGRASIIHVANPMAGTWSALLDLSSATGCTQATVAGATPGPFIKVYINGTLHTLSTLTA